MAQRTGLKKLVEQRMRFRGTFVRLGFKPAFRGPDLQTVLLQNIISVETEQIVTDHLWFNYTQGFQAIAPLAEGDVIEFDARIKPYERGYKGRREDVYKPVEWDYKLSVVSTFHCIGGLFALHLVKLSSAFR